MKKLVIGAVLLAVLATAARAQIGITFFPGPGMTAGGGGGCSAQNGTMNFSQCSNVGITAAVMP